MADLTHAAHRVPVGHPGEADRRHAADVAERRVQVAARVYVDALTRGDEEQPPATSTSCSTAPTSIPGG